MNEVEKKVNIMIGESTMNEYKAYKNLVKHKRRINHVFSEICGDKSFRSRRPRIPVKVPAVVVASCSAAPLKAPRRRSSQKGKGNIDETSSSIVYLRRPDLLNPINGRENHLKSSWMPKFKRLPASLNLAERRLRRL
jgi:hypothetical protein